MSFILPQCKPVSNTDMTGDQVCIRRLNDAQIQCLYLIIMVFMFWPILRKLNFKNNDVILKRDIVNQPSCR